MRSSVIILFLSLWMVWGTSCRERAHGPKHMTQVDSARRVAAIAQIARLAELGKIHEDFEGPVDPGQGNGEVSKGGKFQTNIQNDSIATVTRSFEKFSAKIKKAQEDSSTAYGVLMSRFKVLDSQHKYLAATYSSDGHLLTFHSEITRDDKHELDYDMYFDHGRLRYIRERRTYTHEDEEEQSLLTDDSYYMSGADALYYYRDEGTALTQHDHMELMHMSRYNLKGDIKGHTARIFDLFKKDYEVLLSQSLEAMIYTPKVRIQMPEVQPDKGVPTKGR